MKCTAKNGPTHIVKGNVLDALGFSASEASVLRVKTEILSAIFENVRAKGYTEAQLVDILDEYRAVGEQPLKVQISRVSMEKKLLRHADRLHLRTSIAVQPIDGRSPCDNPKRDKRATPSANGLHRHSEHLQQTVFSNLWTLNPRTWVDPHWPPHK